MNVALIAPFFTAMYLFAFGVRTAVRVSRQSAARVWTAAIVMLTVAAFALGVAEYLRYWAQQRSTAAALAQTESKTTPNVLNTLLSDPTITKRNVEFLKSGLLSTPSRSAVEVVLSGRAPTEERRVFVPVGNGWYVFIIANASYEYGDVRTLKGVGSEQIDYEIIDSLLRERESYQGSFWRYLRTTYIAGRAVRDDTKRVTAIVLTSSDANRPRTLTLRWLVQLFA